MYNGTIKELVVGVLYGINTTVRDLRGQCDGRQGEVCERGGDRSKQGATG